MASILPVGLTDLATAHAKAGKLYDVMGVVVDFLPPKQSHGADWTIAFTIKDSSWNTFALGEGYRVRYFAEHARLPTVQSVGDVVLLRSIKTNNWLGANGGLSSRSTSWVVFPQVSIPETIAGAKSGLINKKLNLTRVPTQQESEYAVHLCNSTDRPGLGVQPTTKPDVSAAPAGEAVPTNSGDLKFSLIKDLKAPQSGGPLMFKELVGEVRKTWENDNRVEMYISDYTSNKNLFNYEMGCDEEGRDGDDFNYARTKSQWLGPYGKQTMQVALWDAHAAYARAHVKVNDYVFLRNVQIKEGKANANLEGVMRGDKRRPDQTNVMVIKKDDARTDDRMLELLRRKKTYEDSNLGKRKSANDAGDVQKGKNSKKNKKRRQALQKAARASDQAPLQTTKRYEANANVRCKNYNVPLRTLTSILDPTSLQTTSHPSNNPYSLPFQNHCHHAKLRVIDFFPPNLADFSVPCRDKSSSFMDLVEVHSDSSSSDIDSSATEIRWEWRFCLLVQDSGPSPPVETTMQLLVAEQDGDFLLNMEAVDLRQNETVLAKLREKLFVLWGNLEERKQQMVEQGSEGLPALNNMPFECCIKEYGVLVRGAMDESDDEDEDEDGDVAMDGTAERAGNTTARDLARERQKRGIEYERRFRIFGATIK